MDGEKYVYPDTPTPSAPSAAPLPADGLSQELRTGRYRCVRTGRMLDVTAVYAYDLLDDDRWLVLGTFADTSESFACGQEEFFRAGNYARVS